MRYSVLVGATLAGAFVLGSCSDNATGNQSGESFSLAAAGNGNSCKPPKVHPVGSIIGTVSAPSPWGVAVRDDGLSYFTAVYNNQVGITNTTTRTITGFITVGSVPTGVTFSPDGTRGYVANQDGTVSVIDVSSSAVIATIFSGGSSPFSVQVSPDGTLLYVGNNDNTLLVVDTQTFQIIKTVTVGYATNAFVVSPNMRTVYASSFVSGTVSEIDIFTSVVLRTFTVGGTPQGMATNKKGTHLYVANEAGRMDDVDLVSGQLGAPIPLVGGGFGVDVSPDDNLAWIAIPNNGVVQIYDMKKGKMSGSLNVGGSPRRVAFSDGGKIGAVTNQAGYITFVK